MKREEAFTNSFRFIDDLAVLNNGSEFERSFQEIYASVLDFRKKNFTGTEISFLDLGIKIEDNRFSMSHYDE